MSQWTTTLRPGLPIAFDGEQFTVAEIEGRRILLRQSAVAGLPKLRQVDISVLLAHPSTEILTQAPAETTASTALLSGLAPPRSSRPRLSRRTFRCGPAARRAN